MGAVALPAVRARAGRCCGSINSSKPLVFTMKTDTCKTLETFKIHQNVEKPIGFSKILGLPEIRKYLVIVIFWGRLGSQGGKSRVPKRCISEFCSGSARGPLEKLEMSSFFNFLIDFGT